MIAALTSIPVIGVPIESKKLKGLDSLLSIVQMPKGIPVATVAIGKDGAINSALLAASIISNFDNKIKNDLDSTLTFRKSCAHGVCGSCAMNVDGVNTLSCMKSHKDIKDDLRIFHLPHLKVVKDLVADLSLSLIHI